MKLRNKRTGEIVMVCKINPEPYEARDFECSSLAELNEEWEDYQEPKKWYSIDMCGKVCEWDAECWAKEQKDSMKAIGNYFETREEAEKAVEKLKAWKRMKDKGFRFEGWDNTDRSTIHNFSLFVAIEDLENINKDLDLLFGGEE